MLFFTVEFKSRWLLITSDRGKASRYRCSKTNLICKTIKWANVFRIWQLCNLQCQLLSLCCQISLLHFFNPTKKFPVIFPFRLYNQDWDWTSLPAVGCLSTQMITKMCMYACIKYPKGMAPLFPSFKWSIETCYTF